MAFPGFSGSSGFSVEHLLRRAGFGARQDELDTFSNFTRFAAVDQLVNYENIPDDVDSKIGQAGYAGVTPSTSGPFAPNSNINDARQRWLFRMLHTNRPLQEKMTLFWHNHFATGYTKISNALNATEATRYMAAKASEDPAGVQGQIEMLRANALGSFGNILLNIAKDTAMLYWLDGVTNTKAKPQENFGREVMELFSVGVGNYVETDVYAAAKVFSGWNAQRVGTGTPPSGATGDGQLSPQHYVFFYNANQHDTSAKTFSFPIYSDGTTTIPARTAANGMQDGLDLIAALAASPNTARYLAKKLYRFFVNDQSAPDQAVIDPDFVQAISTTFLQSGGDMKAVMTDVLLSQQFNGTAAPFARYSWPVEFAIRALKDVGWKGFSLNNALTPLTNMQQTLFEPPNVAGWPGGSTWFSSGAMLARMNFASTLAGNQKFNLATAAQGAGAASSAAGFLSYYLDQLATTPFADSVLGQFSSYLTATGAWTGSAAQMQQKAPGVVHLLLSSPEYQLI
jgi:uncharacterized protein (DUF1800 family)